MGMCLSVLYRPQKKFRRDIQYGIFAFLVDTEEFLTRKLFLKMSLV